MSRKRWSCSVTNTGGRVVRIAEKREPDTVRDILSYLLRHPEAADTLDGIARWWLQRECVDYSVEEVAKALHFLVRLGFIVEKRSTAKRAFFQIDPTKQSEIMAFIKEEVRA